MYSHTGSHDLICHDKLSFVPPYYSIFAAGGEPTPATEPAAEPAAGGAEPAAEPAAGGAGGEPLPGTMEPGAEGAGGGAAAFPTIADAAAAAPPNISILMAAVNASNLTAALSDPTTTWTIFAPTDEVSLHGE